jgi:hypothetical protein
MNNRNFQHGFIAGFLAALIAILIIGIMTT